MDLVDALAREVAPDTSVALSSSGLRRLHAGRYRVPYEMDDEAATVTIIHLGRLG